MNKEAATHCSRRASALWTSLLFVLVSVLPGCGLIARQATIAYIAVNSHFSPKEIEIALNKSFIEAYKNRVTIHTTFTVDKAMASPLPAAIDGDLHLAGRAPQVGLPIVGEIANAADEKAAIDLVHGSEGTGKPLKVSGVWRIWPEHPGSAEEVQGKPLEALGSYRPDHVFEIHPVTAINAVQLPVLWPSKASSLGARRGPSVSGMRRPRVPLSSNPRRCQLSPRRGSATTWSFIMEIAERPAVRGGSDGQVRDRLGEGPRRQPARGAPPHGLCQGDTP